MLINHNINNLSGGVSQQDDSLRFDNQVEEMINFYPTVADGLKRRNPIKLLANLGGVSFDENITTHTYARDDGINEYGFILDSTNGLRAYKTSGFQMTITDTSGIINKWKTYNPNWKRDIQFITVGDTTWILNRKVNTLMLEDTTPVQTDNTVFFWVKRSFKDTDGNGYSYTATVNGVSVTVNHYDSTVVADRLVNGYDSGELLTHTNGLKDILGTTLYDFKVYGSIFMVRTKDGSQISNNASDSWGNQAMSAWRREIARLSDLPSDLSGFTESDVGIIKITGSDKDNFASYYIKWNETNWTESVASGLVTTIDKESMPIKLTLNADNLGFTLSYIDWDLRAKGDDDSNQIPSFIGDDIDKKYISNMFFFKNRLGFTSGESVILSEVGNYYNFFATTVMEIIDSDMIDVTIDSDTTSNISFVNVSSGGLTIWSSSGQFLLSGGEVLSPETTRVTKISSYSADNVLQPIAVDNEILFYNKIGDYLDVMSYAPVTLEADRTSASSLTSHIQNYIPSNIKSIATSSAYDIVFFLPYGSNDIYCYSYFIRGNERLMSAFYKWNFPSLTNIKDIIVMSNLLYIISDTNSVYTLTLKTQDLDLDFLDYGSVVYESKVIMSRYNVMTQQGSRAIREPFYIKSLKTKVDGYVDIDIINSERNSTKTINNKHKNRRLFIGGNSDKINIGFRTSNTKGCSIGVISLEGITKTRSRNI